MPGSEHMPSIGAHLDVARVNIFFADHSERHLLFAPCLFLIFAMHLEAILDGCSFILSAAICVLVGHTIFLIIELYQEQHHPSETCKRLNPLVMPER